MTNLTSDPESLSPAHSPSTLSLLIQWIREHGTSLTRSQRELEGLRQELARVKLERDIYKERLDLETQGSSHLNGTRFETQPKSHHESLEGFDWTI
jgi:hypothetical protein